MNCEDFAKDGVGGSSAHSITHGATRMLQLNRELLCRMPVITLALLDTTNHNMHKIPFSHRGNNDKNDKNDNSDYDDVAWSCSSSGEFDKYKTETLLYCTNWVSGLASVHHSNDGNDRSR